MYFSKGGKRTEHIFKVQFGLGLLPPQRELALFTLPADFLLQNCKTLLENLSRKSSQNYLARHVGVRGEAPGSDSTLRFS